MTVQATPPSLIAGLRPIDRSFESWWVRPGSATAVELHAGDRVTIIDPDGGQPAEVTVVPDVPASASARTLRPPFSPACLRVGRRRRLSRSASLRRGLRPEEARAARLFGPDSAPGASEVVRRGSRLRCSSSPRRAAGSWTAIRPRPRSSSRSSATFRGSPSDVPLPEPLAEPRLDFRVDRASALAYEVREGEYIQVIDVQGRQCSDFLAFHRAKLDKGLERGMDGVTTRTLMGAAYPLPGLYSKFFDVDMDPLVQVVRDTVGRHDTFGLACTRRYYEDMGYPGHVNCSDNFNEQVDPYGIPARAGWEAVNFFFNTRIEADNVLVSDEPWSRPGDYVLMKAMTDLVCASSACPDDIDPANAWECTDIHVRVYSPENRFSTAIAHRVTPEAEPVLTKETAFHPRTSELTESFVEYRGYWLPHCFNNEGAIGEYWACREKAVIMDLSPLRKWEVLGPDAETLIQHAITRDARRLAVGQVVYTAICNETGGMIDDATVFRLGDDNFRFIGGDEYDGVWLKELGEKLGLKAFVKPSTDQLHNVAVQGPNSSRDIMRELIWTPPTQPSLDGPEVVPLPGRPDRRLPGDPGRGVAHRLHRRARLRGLLPPGRRRRPSGTRSGRPGSRTA